MEDQRFSCCFYRCELWTLILRESDTPRVFRVGTEQNTYWKEGDFMIYLTSQHFGCLFHYIIYYYNLNNLFSKTNIFLSLCTTYFDFNISSLGHSCIAQLIQSANFQYIRIIQMEILI